MVDTTQLPRMQTFGPYQPAPGQPVSLADVWAGAPYASAAQAGQDFSQGNIAGGLGAGARSIAQIPIGLIGRAGLATRAIGSAVGPPLAEFGRQFVGGATPAPAAPLPQTPLAAPPKRTVAPAGGMAGPTPGAPAFQPAAVPQPQLQAPDVISGGRYVSQGGQDGFTNHDLAMLQGMYQPRVSPAEHVGYDILSSASAMRDAALAKNPNMTPDERLTLNNQYVQYILQAMSPQLALMRALQGGQGMP